MEFILRLDYFSSWAQFLLWIYAYVSLGVVKVNIYDTRSKSIKIAR